MALSFRTKLLASHVGLVLVVGRHRDLHAQSLAHRRPRPPARSARSSSSRRKGAIEWAEEGGKRHPDKVATRIAHIVDAEVTLLDKDGTVHRCIDARGPHRSRRRDRRRAQAGGVGKATRMRGGQEMHYVAVPGAGGHGPPPRDAALRDQRDGRRDAAAPALRVDRSPCSPRSCSGSSRRASRPGRSQDDDGDRDAPRARRVRRADPGRRQRRVRRRSGARCKSLAAQLQGADRRRSSRSAIDCQRLMTIRRDFVANVSHELRTPVTVIQGYAETLLREGPPAETRSNSSRSIHRQAQRIGALVEQLLALSELEARGTDDVAREAVERALGRAARRRDGRAATPSSAR